MDLDEKDLLSDAADLNLDDFLDSETGNGKCVYYLCDEETVKTCKACYSTCSPLSFDINGDGINTSNDVIDYDIDGDGATDKIYDSADAVLVFDKDGDGISGADGSECFGNNTDLDGDGIKDGFKDGFEALKTMAEKENLIGENDSKLDESDLKYLQEKYGLKIKTDGTFYHYSKVLTNEEIDNLSKISEQKLNETALNIKNNIFNINPKKDKENFGCRFCKFKDICFMEEYDTIKIEKKGDENDSEETE